MHKEIHCSTVQHMKFLKDTDFSSKQVQTVKIFQLKSWQLLAGEPCHLEGIPYFNCELRRHKMFNN